MAVLKTKVSSVSVDEFIKKLSDPQKRKDAIEIIKLMEKTVKEKGKMWGTSIIGFGNRHLKYESGREIEWFILGFSPRKSNFSLYLPGGLEKKKSLLEKLGKYKTGKGCIYINKLEDVNVSILNELIKTSIQYT